MYKLLGTLLCGVAILSGCEPVGPVTAPPANSALPKQTTTTETTRTEKKVDGQTVESTEVVKESTDIDDLSVDPSDNTREEFIAETKRKIDQLNAAIARWEDRAAAGAEEMKAKWIKEREKLEKRRDKMNAELEKLQAASSDAWIDLKIGARKAWDELKDAIGNAAEHFKSDTTTVPNP